MKKFSLFLLLSIFLVLGCESTLINDEATGVDADVQVMHSTPLAEIEDKWSSAVRRGDADSAPTYNEFMFDMNAVSESLQNLVASNDVSSEIKDISERLTLSLKRGDAELAPTYEEALTDASNLLQEFRAAIESEGVTY